MISDWLLVFFLYFCRKMLFMKRNILLFLIIFVSSISSFSQEKIKVACIGNSVTYGYCHENPSVTSYPSQLAAMLGDDYEVGNFGKSGATLLRKGHRPYNEQEEYKKALAFAPDIAIIHLGLNDTDPRNWKYYKREFITDYIALIEDIERVNPEVEIFICRMSPIFHWHHRFLKGTRDWYWEIQETIENIAENIAEVKLIDLQESLYQRPDLMPDALHPNPEGAGLIAQCVYSAITGDYGGLSVPDIYSDNMVLQRDVPFAIEGSANAGDEISVRFNGKTIKTHADYRGRWEVCFDTLRVDGKIHKLTIKSKDNILIFNNIKIGEVILFSGQIDINNKEEYHQNIHFDESKDIVLYNMKPIKASHISEFETWNDIEKGIVNNKGIYVSTSWEKFDGDEHSMLYNIGTKLYDSLQMPIGLIYNVVEDAPIEAFIDRKTIEWHPTLIDVLYEWRNTENVREDLHPYEPSYLYDCGIKPLTSFPIKSVIWLMKDTDSQCKDSEDVKMSALIGSWRRAWNDDDLGFYPTVMCHIL